MRNLLLILLLANILYFVWGTFVQDESERGIQIVSEEELGPPLSIVSARDGEDGAIVGREPDSEQPDSAQPQGPARGPEKSCATLGPFRASGEAEAALAEVTGEGIRAAMRQDFGIVFVGHWVRIRHIADRPTANEMVSRLHGGGLADAYLSDSEEDGLYISLGLFGNIARAQKVERQARSLELPAFIDPITREGQMYFVDVSLAPGTGSGGLAQKYGEDKVVQGAAAACPPAD